MDPSSAHRPETKPTKADHTAPVHTGVATDSKLSSEKISGKSPGHHIGRVPPSHGKSSSSKLKGKQPSRTKTQPPDTSEDKLTSKDNPDKDLIMGYLFPTNPGEIPPLQPRRTLDQYFYAHLESTSHRDADQVVYRYTIGTSEAKLFMVDQLWLWILNEGR